MDDVSDRVNVDDDDVDDGGPALPAQTLEESLRSQLRCALSALAERDATIQGLQKSLDEAEAARAELQTAVGRLEARVEELDVSVQNWCRTALDAEGSLDKIEDERDALRKERDRLLDDRHLETVRMSENSVL